MVAISAGSPVDKVLTEKKLFQKAIIDKGKEFDCPCSGRKITIKGNTNLLNDIQRGGKGNGKKR